MMTMPDPAWKPHQQIIDREPKLAGYPTACVGTLRIVEDDPDFPLHVRCDQCGESYGVARAVADDPSDEPPRREWAF